MRRFGRRPVAPPGDAADTEPPLEPHVFAGIQRMQAQQLRAERALRAATVRASVDVIARRERREGGRHG